MNNGFNLNDHPHRRFNPLTKKWILVSPHRAKRPWQGQVEKQQEDKRPSDPTCYLCPGNKRAEGTFIHPRFIQQVLINSWLDTKCLAIRDEILLLNGTHKN